VKQLCVCTRVRVAPCQPLLAPSPQEVACGRRSRVNTMTQCGSVRGGHGFKGQGVGLRTPCSSPNPALENSPGGACQIVFFMQIAASLRPRAWFQNHFFVFLAFWQVHKFPRACSRWCRRTRAQNSRDTRVMWWKRCCPRRKPQHDAGEIQRRRHSRRALLTFFVNVVRPGGPALAKFSVVVVRGRPC